MVVSNAQWEANMVAQSLNMLGIRSTSGATEGKIRPAFLEHELWRKVHRVLYLSGRHRIRPQVSRGDDFVMV